MAENKTAQKLDERIECLIAPDGKLADTPEEMIGTISKLTSQGILGKFEGATLSDHIRKIQKQTTLKSATYKELMEVMQQLEQATAYVIGAEANPGEEKLQKVVMYGSEKMQDYLKNRYQIVGVK
ncbi:hypothetical protein HY643_03965 [Candidatus Woesearchaeota archaeon]|nr:hypothetical protein [Candidatus Woesearchaeota archaeon]